jgi:hypothetical protein
MQLTRDKPSDELQLAAIIDKLGACVVPRDTMAYELRDALSAC